MTIIDPAYLPMRPIKPKRMVLGLMTLGLSAMLGVLWAFARVLFDDVIFDAADVEAVGPEVLVSIPQDPIEDSRSALVVRRGKEKQDEAVQATVTPSASGPLPPRRFTSAGGRAAPLTIPPVSNPAVALDLLSLAEDPAEEEPSPVEVIAFASPRSVRSEGELPLIGSRAIAALRILRYRIEQRAVDGRMVVGITSAIPGEGKSRLAVQLALALVESDRARVLLVESNLERPSLARLLGVEIPDGQGFSMQLRRRAMEGRPAPWGVVACGGSMHLLAENTRNPTWPGMLHSRELRVAIEELRPCYDYIVMDGPSILGEGGATSVERAVDGFVIVARAKVTRGTSLLRAARMLGQERLLGVVLTDVKEEA